MGYDQEKLIKYHLKSKQLFLLGFLEQIIKEFDLETINENGYTYFNVSPIQVILDNDILRVKSKSYANKIVKPLYENNFIIKANKKVKSPDCFIRLNVKELKYNKND